MVDLSRDTIMLIIIVSNSEERDYGKRVSIVIDSRATDHCLVQRDDFIKYIAFAKLVFGWTAWKKTIFEITRQEIVGIWTEVDKLEVNITLQNVLYTLGLHLDLILIPRIYA